MQWPTRREVLGLAAVLAGDAAFNVVATEWVTEDLEHLGFPSDLRNIFPVIKTSAAAGLVGGLRWPRLGQLTARALIAYFLIAIGFHVRARDTALRISPAIGMLTWSVIALRVFQSRATRTSEPVR